MSIQTRKIIRTSVTDNNIIIATCEDGTCWTIPYDYQIDGWKQLPPIPQYVPIIKPINIYVNGKMFEFDGPSVQLTYEELCNLAGKPNQQPTITFSLKFGLDGEVRPGGNTVAYPNTYFTVVDTNNA